MAQPANYTEDLIKNQISTDNLIIQGDNLDALKSLLPFYSGSIKCIFIDPPYNTGSAFSHYDDNLEQSLWLNMMYPRLELLRELLAEDGSIWITLDDNESHYCKVMCDEIFGRNNFVANAIWEKKFSPQNDAKWLSDNHDHILCYAKNKEKWRPNLLPRSAEALSSYKNLDNDPRGLWTSSDFSVKTYNSEYDYPITTPSGKIINPAKGRCWQTNKAAFQKLVDDNRIWFGKNRDNVPRVKKFLSEVKDGVTALTIWKYTAVGHNQNAKKETKEFNSDEVFDTPKPEALLQRILTLASNEHDLVLDSFLGSGTTAAVAHKMNRRYIGIEIGEHAKTHVVPRLKKVIDGEQGGVSGSLNWQGGGSFRFCELGETLFDEYGSLNAAVKFADLAAYIWFLRTKQPSRVGFNPHDKTENGGLKPTLQTPTPLIGVHHNTAYYLLYNGILGDKRPAFGNVLTRKILAELPDLAKHLADGLNIVVYGEACRVSDETLQDNRMTFKQIPYHVTDK
ncbi:site-specific DNA-methyltransferase [Kingella negevensis]|uniref:site-specific DNA-methyltransferase n=1 Tax=Kingella negevensis TaxID=1522312 RepID=UPI002543E404|nr:site-specific DNA-methyltransferase [Kingella negevensis]WII93026.1 site-specific DNA-methyltransferase [Kingella negevensis]